MVIITRVSKSWDDPPSKYHMLARSSRSWLWTCLAKNQLSYPKNPDQNRIKKGKSRILSTKPRSLWIDCQVTFISTFQRSPFGGVTTTRQADRWLASVMVNFGPWIVGSSHQWCGIACCRTFQRCWRDAVLVKKWRKTAKGKFTSGFVIRKGRRSSKFDRSIFFRTFTTSNEKNHACSIGMIKQAFRCSFIPHSQVIIKVTKRPWWRWNSSSKKQPLLWSMWPNPALYWMYEFKRVPSKWYNLNLSWKVGTWSSASPTQQKGFFFWKKMSHLITPSSTPISSRWFLTRSRWCMWRGWVLLVALVSNLLLWMS